MPNLPANILPIKWLYVELTAFNGSRAVFPSPVLADPQRSMFLLPPGSLLDRLGAESKNMDCLGALEHPVGKHWSSAFCCQIATAVSCLLVNRSWRHLFMCACREVFTAYFFVACRHQRTVIRFWKTSRTTVLWINIECGECIEPIISVLFFTSYCSSSSVNMKCGLWLVGQVTFWKLFYLRG